MRQSNWTPSIVPTATIRPVIWWRMIQANPAGLVEADVETTDLETIIQDLLTGQ